MIALVLRSLALVISVVLLSGCGTSPVADDLSQREANRIVAALRGKGIDATTDKERGSRGRYSVAVASSDFGRAASLLAELGMPEAPQASFAELVAPSGFLPSSRDVEALRLDRAVAAEVEDLLRGHPAISDAHAIVRYHSLADGAQPTLSVIAQKKAGAAISSEELRGLVSRVLPSEKQQVDVSIAVAEPHMAVAGIDQSSQVTQQTVPFLVFWEVPASQYNGLAGLLIGLLVVASGLAGLGGYIFGQYTVSKQQLVGRGDASAGAAATIAPRRVEEALNETEDSE